MRANTARSSVKREAKTTDEDMAAFKDNTDVNLPEGVNFTLGRQNTSEKTHLSRARLPVLVEP